MPDALTPEQWLARHRSDIEAANEYGWELVFAEEVLTRLHPTPLSDMSCIRPQRKLNLNGVDRYIDFAIEIDDVWIAIELDGRDKARERLTPQEWAQYFERWEKRERALVLRGYRVFRFANTEFGRADGSSVAPKPEGVRQAVEQLNMLIRNERTVAAAKARVQELRLARREVADLQQRRQELETELDKTKHLSQTASARADAELAALRANLTTREQSIEELEARLTRAEQDLDAALELADQANASASAAAEVERATIALAEGKQSQEELDQLVAHSREQEARIADLQRELAAAKTKEAETERDMKWVAVAVVSLAVALVVAVVVLSSGGGDEEPVRAQQASSPTRRPSATARPSPTQAPVAASSACDGTLDWTDVADCLREEITFRGRIVGTSYNTSASGAPTFLNVGNDFPTTPRVTLVIWDDCREDFIARTGFPPEEYYRGTDVVVTGTAELYNGQPQVDLCAPGNRVSGE